MKQDGHRKLGERRAEPALGGVLGAPAQAQPSVPAPGCPLETPHHAPPCISPGHFPGPAHPKPSPMPPPYSAPHSSGPWPCSVPLTLLPLSPLMSPPGHAWLQCSYVPNKAARAWVWSLDHVLLSANWTKPQPGCCCAPGLPLCLPSRCLWHHPPIPPWDFHPAPSQAMTSRSQLPRGAVWAGDLPTIAILVCRVPGM